MSARFYINCPLAPGPVDLEGPEARHLAAVCRLRPGDALCLFNGDGHEYPARVLAVERRLVTVEVLAVARSQRELGFPLIVAAPLPKGDRAQFLVEKLTEIGVTTFVPLDTQHSVVSPRAARLEKLERYVIEASKQCGRNVLMRVESQTSWETYCRRPDLPGLKLFAHPGSPPLAPASPSALGFTLAVGPEGGFAEDECAGARAAGWQAVDLGPRLLRIETAALVLASWVTLSRFP